MPPQKQQRSARSSNHPRPSAICPSSSSITTVAKRSRIENVYCACYASWPNGSSSHRTEIARFANGNLMGTASFACGSANGVVAGKKGGVGRGRTWRASAVAPVQQPHRFCTTVQYARCNSKFNSVAYYQLQIIYSEYNN